MSGYTGETEAYVKQYRRVLMEDCERFAIWFAGDDCWMALVIVGTLLASIVFPKLPDVIPVQWSAGEVTKTAPRGALFAYPLLMLVIRFLLGGRIRMLCRNAFAVWGERIAPYAVNGLCLLMLCLEAFTVLYLFGTVSSVEAAIFIVCAFVLGVILVAMRVREK